MARMSMTQRRALLLKAAEAVVVRDGFAGLTTRAIAEEAGMTQGHFHYCYRDKDELLEELVARTMAELRTQATASIVRGPTVADTVSLSLEAMWNLFSGHPQRLLLLFELTTFMVRDTASSPMAGAQYSGYQDVAERFLDDLAEAVGGTWADPVPVVGRLLVAVVDGLGLRWLTDRDDGVALAALAVFGDQLADRLETPSGE